MLSSINFMTLNIICTIIVSVMLSVLFVLCIILLVQKIRFFKHMNIEVNKTDITDQEAGINPLPDSS